MREAVGGAALAGVVACGAVEPQVPTGRADAVEAAAVSPGPRHRLEVAGNQLLYAGRPARLRGVNHSGSEYACVKDGGRGVFDGPDADALAGALAGWGPVNAVRLPLNEDCWLGINGVRPEYGGDAYRRAVARYARALAARGLFVILDLHWSAPGSHLAQGQEPMADRDHAPAFWRSVAATFAADPRILFDLFNEPFLDAASVGPVDPWVCWRDGCAVRDPQGPGTFQSAGMQELVDAARSSGARNVILVGGLAYGNDLSGWLAHAPRDPQGRLAAAFHVYNFNACATPACWQAEVATVAAQVPVVTGEVGEDDCGRALLDAYLDWADAHGVSYLAWTWNPWGCASGPSLITGYDGSPTPFGLGLREHLLRLPP